MPENDVVVEIRWKIAADGTIANWHVDLSEFQEPQP